MLSNAQVKAIYAAKSARENRSQTSSKGFVLVRKNGELTRVGIARMSDHDFGDFVGKVGSIRRTTKGRSRRLANGRRKYASPRYATNEVIAYLVK
jgi:hypothetical protein